MLRKIRFRLLRFGITPVLYFVFVACALAHSPYYTQMDEVRDANGEPVSIKILNGDGIFIADPQQAVVIDSEGRLLAASMISPMLFLSCHGPDDARECLVYDELSESIFEFDKSVWQPIKQAETGGEPVFYPENDPVASGFRVRKASPWEVVKYELLAGVSAPATTLFSIGWWTMIFLLPLPTIFDLFSKKRREKEKRIYIVLTLLLKLLLSSLLIGLAAFVWIIRPYSIYFLMFSVLSGLLISLLLVRRSRSA